MRHIHKASYGLIVCFVLCSPVIAEVYKYQDENGTWHFSDTPPPGTQPRQTISKAYKTKDDSSDLVKKLHDKFKPRTPIEEATLSVVSIETPLAQGSGFFIS